MAIGDIVTGNNLGDEFDKGTIAPNEIRLRVDGTTVLRAPDGTISSPAPNTSTIWHELYAGGSSDGVQSGSWARNSTVTRTGNGLWTVAFNAAHPDGINYNISLIGEETNDRDSPYMVVFQGTKTANGFNFYIGEGDNGGGADALVDHPWSYGVTVPITVHVP